MSCKNVFGIFLLPSYSRILIHIYLHTIISEKTNTKYSTPPDDWTERWSGKDALPQPSNLKKLSLTIRYKLLSYHGHTFFVGGKVIILEGIQRILCQQ